MAKQITYLLGAGASANCVPMVNGLVDALKKFDNKLENVKIALLGNNNGDYSNTRQSLGMGIQKDIRWLINACENHQTVDTFAKMLFITEQEHKLSLLKALLSILFTYVQDQSRIDIRYDSFWASILGRGAKLPDNIKVITWNYDCQLDISFKIYSTILPTLYEAQELIKSYPLGISSDNDRPFVVHLNGIAGFYKNSHGEVKNLFESYNAQRSVPHKINISAELKVFLDWFEVRSFSYLSVKENTVDFNSLFTFCWETNELSDKSIEYAIDIAKETEVLVVIGYSFPFFNRDYDKKVIGSMKKLEKIYFQNPVLDGSFMRAQFKLPDEPKQVLANEKFGLLKTTKGIYIEHIKDTNQFFLPHEL